MNGPAVTSAFPIAYAALGGQIFHATAVTGATCNAIVDKFERRYNDSYLFNNAYEFLEVESERHRSDSCN